MTMSAPQVELRYRRLGRVVHFETKAMTTEELRTLIVGLWLILDDDIREDMIDELEHYSQDDPHRYPPPVAVAIEDGYRKAQKAGS